MLKTFIKKLYEKNDLTSEQAEEAMMHLINSDDECLIAAFLSLLSAKGETPEELFGMIQALQKKMVVIPMDMPLLDIVGTGGDGANTINISTAASILAASCGAIVAKHGNRAFSSKCGSANLLEKLGIAIEMNPDQLISCIQKIGIGFCFSPRFHPALKKIKHIRDKLGIVTSFNLLGPMLHPAKISYALIGVYKRNLMSKFSQCLRKLKLKKAMIVHGNGLDELNLLGINHVIEISEKGENSYILDPKDFGFNYCRLRDIQGGDADVNAKLILQAFEGKISPISDTIIFNSGAALYISNKVPSIKNGIEIARKNLLSGKALEILSQWIYFGRGITNE